MIQTQPFAQLRDALRGGPHAPYACRLDAAMAMPCTTSSELVAEMGAAVLTIRRACRGLTPEQKRLVRACLAEVRKAWPGFGWTSWYWHYWR